MFYSPTPNRRKSWMRLLVAGHKKLMAVGVLVLVLFVGALSVLGVYVYRAMQYDLSRVEEGLENNWLYDSQGNRIASLAEDAATVVSREELPKHLINAFVAREDESFFEHNGVVISSVLRSVLRNLQSMRYEQGASTITMQLTRNVYGLSGKSMDRKLLEAVLAQLIENRYDKYTIMQQYLSRIFYGQNCYGVKAAARHYFGREVRDLDLVECATLAGLVRAPSLFNPVTSMKKAMQVKKETLQRMLDCEMISQEECDAAIHAPIELRRVSLTQQNCSSYAVMWARHELEGIRSEVPEHSGGISVMSSLLLSLQQYTESAVEAALTAVERPGAYPEAWLDGMTPENALATRTAFSRLRRPSDLKARGENNDLSGLLQCCALVVDARRNHRGKILALVGGRSVADGIDRWQGKVRPGRAAAPFLFCCACLPGGEDMHIVASSTEETGERMGYDVVRSFYESLKLSNFKMPSREQASYLYDGMYQLRRLDLARLLFCLQNEGRGYRLSMVNAIWNSNRQLIYNYEPDKSPEYIRRESASAVSKLPPFHVTEGEPVTMNETLPEGGGQWSMVFRERDVCVFVWMGFDDAAHPLAAARELRPLLSRASMNLAREIFDKARAELRAQKQKAADAKQTTASS